MSSLKATKSSFDVKGIGLKVVEWKFSRLLYYILVEIF